MRLRPRRAGAEVTRDYIRFGLTLREHPVAFLRDDLRQRKFFSCREAHEARDGRRLDAAGLVLVRQRPGSAEGVVFLTLEDESGVLNVIIWKDIFEKYRRVVLAGQMLGIKGRLQKEGEVVHLVALEITDLSALLADVGNRDSDRAGGAVADHSVETLSVKSRNFH